MASPKGQPLAKPSPKAVVQAADLEEDDDDEDLDFGD